MEELLDRFVNNIAFQRIKLIYVNMQTNDELGGIFSNNSIDTSLNIKLSEIKGGKEVSGDKEREILSGLFEFTLDYKNKEQDKLVFLEMKYNVIIGFKKEVNEIFLEKEAKKVIPIFFDNSGRIIVYPYFRNMVDMLTRGAGFVFEPIPPFKINNSK